MPTPKWQPGKLYPPGSLVVPRTAQPQGVSPLQNPGFETGDLTGWDEDIQSQSGTVFIGVRNKDPHTGAYIYALDGSGGSATVEVMNQEQAPVVVGQLVTFRMYLRRSGATTASARLFLRWFDASDVEISTSESPTYTQPETWIYGQVSAAAPSGAAYVRAGFIGVVSGDGDFRFDDATWNATSSVTGLVYRATQAQTGYSGTTEPAWPGVVGVPVVDNEVTWEGVLASRVVWEASPILQSGSTEPVWPTGLGEAIIDGTVSWVTVSRGVEDEKCPQTKEVTIGASKVFAADDDIGPYSATVNPLDWSAKEDAGYLPTGLQAHGSNPLTALGLYNSNLAAFNAEGMQLWQIDENPEAMALLDAKPIGTVHHHALCPVGNDLLFLASEGVRSLSIAAGSTNLQAGDVGMPIDPMVREAMNALPEGSYPMSLYYPAAGQYWLMFPNYPPPEPFDYFMSKTFVDGVLGDQPYLLKLDHDEQSTSLLQDVTDVLTAQQSGFGFAISADFTLAAAGGRDNLSFNYRIEMFSVDAVGAFTSLGAVPLDPRLSDEGNAFPTDISISSDAAYIAATVLGAGDTSDPSFMVYKNDGGNFSILSIPDPSPRFNTQAVSFSPDTNYLAVSRQSPPLINDPILIYRRSGDAFTEVNGLDVRPAGTGTKAGVFSPDSTRFFVADHQDATPGIRVYAVSGDDFLQETIISVPNILVGNLWKSTVAVSSDNTLVACISGPTPNQVLMFEVGGSWDPVPVPPSGLDSSWLVQQVAFVESNRLIVTAYNGSTSELRLVVYSVSSEHVVSLEYTTLLTLPVGVHGSEQALAGSTP